MLNLTRGEIITEGLSLAARPDLTTSARLWLNLFLEEQYHDQDWNWLVKTVSGLAVVQGGTLPLDYRAAKSAKIIDAGGTLRDLRVIHDAAEWDDLRKNSTNSSGTPVFIYIDHDIRTYEFLPVPAVGLTWDLKYYYIPELPEAADAGADGDVVKWGLPAMILVDFIKTKAMEYNDDARTDTNEMKIEKKIAKSKMNAHDRRGGSSQLPMGKSFKKRWPGSSGSGTRYEN